MAEDRLSVYRGKRDFTRTSEPSGQVIAEAPGRARFIIQKHAASRLHYDLRLEHEGVFLSWAVTRGPSLDPADKRLAVEVEPHPLDYGDFEGTIPKGEYGGGTVMLWDRGRYELGGDLSMDRALANGHLSLTFAGERMRGGWSLVMIRHERGRPTKHHNWLLIKHEDAFARPGDGDAFLESTAFSVASGRDMETIAKAEGSPPRPFMTGRPLAADAQWSTTPREAGKTSSSRDRIPDFVPPQLATLAPHPPSGSGWVHEIKFDGYRMQLRREANEARLRTRKGLDWTARFPEIAEDALCLPEGLYDGEIVALDAEERPDFAGLQAALSRRDSRDLVFFLFDRLHDGTADLCGLPLTARKRSLKTALEVCQSPRLRYVSHFEQAGRAVLESVCRMDLEGVVSKRVDAPYASGRGEAWVKAKCRGGQDVVIGGYATTSGVFRSLLAGVWRGDALIYVGRIGAGFGRAVTEALVGRLRSLETDTSPFALGSPRGSAVIHWVRPELVAEIEFAGWTGDGRLRQASFKGLREDLPSREVGGEPQGQRSSDRTPARAEASGAVVQAQRAGSRRGVMVRGITISHPEKVLWPQTDRGAAITKRSLAEYFDAVGTALLDYVRGRPCSLIRTPDGIEGQTFFQRHAGAGASALITQVAVRGDRKPYLQLDSIEALIAAAQSGATEIHPWNCLPGEPDLPGRFVFDLDPDEGLDFVRVIEAAHEVRDRLAEVGLTSFLKTTGGKGLHVVAPLRRERRDHPDWPTAKAFAREICDRMAADSPAAFTTNMSKHARKGKIFLDYLRNDRLSTAVALLSPRARSGAPVSMPLSWTQARAGLDPSAFTLWTVPERRTRSDPWASYQDEAGSLATALEKLQTQGRRRRPVSA